MPDLTNLRALRLPDQGWDSYNALPAVEEASKELARRSDFADLLSSFALMARRHQLLGVVGLFLLHRHFALRAGEAIVESPVSNDGVVTELHARPVSGTPTAWPTRWSLERGRWIAREYSTDNAADRTATVLSGHADFMSELARLLEEWRFDGLLGLAGPERDALPCSSGEEYMEVTSDDASVTRRQPRSHLDQSLIGTLWVPDLAARCNPQWHCMSRCIPEFGRHRHDHGKRFEHRHVPF